MNPATVGIGVCGVKTAQVSLGFEMFKYAYLHGCLCVLRGELSIYIIIVR